jgi:hypothetical protein
MKLRKLPFLYLLVALLSIYFVTTSSSGGVTGLSTSGCSCHGPNSASTSITLTGIPTTGWVAGTTYNMTLTVTNATKIEAGFDMTVDKGTFSNALSGTSLTSANQQLYHTTPKSAISGSTSWSFDWTAPTSSTSTLVIFKVAGNAVNGNNSDSGDQPNVGTFSFIEQTSTTTPPTISLTSIASITSTGATINGSANAQNVNASVSVEYGTTTAYGSTMVATPALVSGSANTPVTATLSSLTPSTLYHVRYKIANTNGTVYSPDSTFTTSAPAAQAPSIVLGSVSNITQTGATINAQVNANNATATVTVQYGLTTSYGSTMNMTPNTVNGSTLTAVNAVLTSLSPNTTYHYRVVANNTGGNTNSADATFMTSPTRVDDFETSGFILYPNPAQNVFVISSKENLNQIQVYAINMMGSQMKLVKKNSSSTSVQFDVTNLASGNYILRVERNGKNYLTGFMKQ